MQNRCFCFSGTADTRRNSKQDSSTGQRFKGYLFECSLPPLFTLTHNLDCGFFCFHCILLFTLLILSHSLLFVRTHTSMDPLIKSVAQQIGVDEAVAKKAVGAVLNFIKDNNTNIDWTKILESLQGAQDVMDTTRAGPEQQEETGTTAKTESTSGGGGLLGLVFSLLKMFGVIAMLKTFLQPIFGDSVVKLIDSAEDGAQLATIMNQLGINREQGVQVVQSLFAFMKDHLDADLVDQIFDAVPAAKAFLGDTKKEE